ncbi:hypothetical protein SUGI_0684080 [Cryptomeria japonica]|nr:hypothetical protein SUGI_0684080 [Cryptomeria japonica]
MILTYQECGELSKGLLWLRWFGIKHRYIPSWLSMENIRVLELLQGHLKYLKKVILDCLWWDGYGEVIEESDSKLSSLPEEFCQLHSLEHLALRGYRELSSLPSRFGDLVNLRHIDLTWCLSLEILPESFKQLIHLECLNLSDCDKLTLESNILERDIA